MRKLCYLASILLLSSLFVCCSNMEEKNVTVSFRESVKDSVFKMSQLFEEKYDSFYILRPYSCMDSLNHLEMSNKLKKLCVDRLKLSDDVFIILLSENNAIKAYSKICRNDVAYFMLPYYKGISIDAPLSVVPDSTHTHFSVKLKKE